MYSEWILESLKRHSVIDYFEYLWEYSYMLKATYKSIFYILLFIINYFKIHFIQRSVFWNYFKYFLNFKWVLKISMLTIFRVSPPLFPRIHHMTGLNVNFKEYSNPEQLCRMWGAKSQNSFFFFFLIRKLIFL